MTESQRPDPRLLADVSYYLGIASAAIILIALILGFARLPGAFIVWLSVITSAVGWFAGWAARQDLASEEGQDNAQERAAAGIRINRIALITMVVLLLITTVIRIAILLLPAIR